MKRLKTRSVLSMLFCAALLMTMALPSGAGTVKIEKISFKGWDKCYRISNGEVELIAVADIGPRLLRYGFIGGKNLLCITNETAGVVGGDEWNSFGGHRLWVAPETSDITYYQDNYEIDAKINGNTLLLTSPIEILDDSLRKTMSQEDIDQKANDPEFRKKLRFRKEMEITMEDNGEITLMHRITNCGLKTYKLAPWVLTVMETGGICVSPNPKYAPHGPEHWLPERALITWSYTDMVDPRLKLMKKYITIQQDKNNSVKFKLGLSYTQNWVAYALDEALFVKNLDYFEGAEYPDMGCSVEIFTNNEMMEVESIGPLVQLKPGDMTSHRERWKLMKIKPITQDEASIDKMLESVEVKF